MAALRGRHFSFPKHLDRGFFLVGFAAARHEISETNSK
jgi:hypothetical protein